MKRFGIRQILLIGFLIRVILAPFTGHPWDIKVWLHVGEQLFEGNLFLYSLNLSPEWTWGYYAYPPGWLSWCAVSYLFHWNLNLYAFILKIPLIVADLLIAYSLYLILKYYHHSESVSVFGAALFLLNPLTILISAVWGMFDAIPTVFSLVALITFLQGKKLFSGILLGMSILFKIYPILLIPLFSLYDLYHHQFQIREHLKFLVTSFSIPVIASLPFLFWDGTGFVLSLLHHGSVSGWMSYWFPLSHLLYAIRKYSGIIALTIFLLLYLHVSKTMLKEKIEKITLFHFSLLIFLIFFLTSPKVNPQYVIWILPFLIIYVLSNQFRSLFLFYGLTASVTLIVLMLMPLNNYFLLNIHFSLPASNIVNILVMIIIISSIVFPLLCFLLFRSAFKGGVLRFRGIKKVGIMLTLIIIVVGFFAAPIPMKMRLNDGIVLAIPESPATGFSPLSHQFGVTEFYNKYRCDAVVLTFGPDFVNTYQMFNETKDVTQYFKTYRYQTWSYRDIDSLVTSLHGEGIKAYLGLFTQQSSIIDNRGYSSQWTINHPQIVENDILMFNTMLSQEGQQEPYYAFFGNKTVTVVNDFNFDGVAILNLGVKEVSQKYLEGLLSLTQYLKGNIQGEIILCDSLDKDHFTDYHRLLKNTDYLILQFSPWSRGIYFLETQYSLNHMEVQIRNILNEISFCDMQKILIMIEVMDEQEGWINSTYFFYQEMDLVNNIRVGGITLIHANQASPFSLKK